MLRNLIFVCLVGTVLSARQSSAQIFAVIVNKSNPTTSLTKEEVSNLFLKKTTQWKDGQSVLPVDLSDKSPTRKAFSETMLRKPAGAVKSYWQQQVFSGRATAPVQQDNEKAVLRYVQDNPGAIGYISPDVNYAAYRVKIVEVD